MTIADRITETPGWVSWTILGSSWVAALLQPLAIIVTITYGALQIYFLLKKHRVL